MKPSIKLFIYKHSINLPQLLQRCNSFMYKNVAITVKLASKLSNMSIHTEQVRHFDGLNIFYCKQ